MANLAPVKALEERHDNPADLDQKAQALADRIKESNHFIAFTGAGISTTAGIPDFRGPEGVWTLRAQGRERDIKTVNTLQAVPTPTHMALVELQNQGLLKFLVSQNCDGLHRKSGIRPDMIAELHGNNNREYCKDCGKEFIRDFRAVSTYQKSIHDHRTGRKCALCGGPLLDSIINFGESLPEAAITSAFHHAAKADLCLVLGSSLTVSPANEIPSTVALGGDATLAICNLQDTPIDGLADLRTYSSTDDLMVRVMQKLKLPIPPFILQRRIVVEVQPNGPGRQQLAVRGVEVDDTPSTFLQSVKLAQNRRTVRSEPFVISLRDALQHGAELRIELGFMCHYGEPNLELFHYFDSARPKTLYLLEYSPQIGEWKGGKQP